MKRVLVWFTTDLRLHDNETLIRAIEAGNEVIPVYCFDDAHYTKTKYGTQKTGSFRAKFIIESLVDLDKSLRAIGSGLLVVRGKPEIEITALAKQYQVQQVFAKQEVAPEELQKQLMLDQHLARINCTLVTVATSALYHEKDLPFAINNIPDVFTNFRKEVEKSAAVRLPLGSPLKIHSPSIATFQLPSLVDLGLEEKLVDRRSVINFQGGETAAWDRLEHYFFRSTSLSTYKESRNGLLGADYSSKFSVWLSTGCISARSIYGKIKQYEKEVVANESTYWLYFELLWRDYFIYMMIKYGRLFFQKNGIKSSYMDHKWHQSELFEKWKNGKTGNDFIDAHMKELQLSGFMSNRGRQIVASYFCHYLKLDWRYGAAYFEEQLIDYDVCSNWGNWAYLAGVGNDPRSHRVFNIEKQANDYDKNKKFRNLWLNKM